MGLFEGAARPQAGVDGAPGKNPECPQLTLRVRRTWRESLRSRDQINKQKNIYLTLVAIGFAVLIILAFTEKYIPALVFRPILYSALALFGVGNTLLYIGIRCPKCNSIIGYAIVFSAGKADQCPRCRVTFDGDLP